MAPACGKMMGNAAGGDLENYFVVVEHMHTTTFIFQTNFMHMHFFFSGCMRHSDAWILDNQEFSLCTA
jgi:hypothetical protein